ncbi:MAG: thioesterase family protein, partial [Actinomycetota bacterium]
MLEPGLQATVQETVTEGMTATSFGSGDVDVLATPAVLALAEAASVAAVADHLEEGTTTVGASVTLDHLAPTPVGAIVIATSGLVEVDGQRLTFSFEVTDAAG